MSMQHSLRTLGRFLGFEPRWKPWIDSAAEGYFIRQIARMGEFQRSSRSGAMTALGRHMRATSCQRAHPANSNWVRRLGGSLNLARPGSDLRETSNVRFGSKADGLHRTDFRISALERNRLKAVKTGHRYSRPANRSHCLSDESDRCGTSPTSSVRPSGLGVIGRAGHGWQERRPLKNRMFFRGRGR